MSTRVGTVRKTPNEWWVGLVAGMASFVDAMAAVGIGIALVIYQATIGITPGEIGIATGVLTFCVAIGAFVGGRLGDRFGRRSVFIVTMVMIIIGSALGTFGTAFPIILTGVILIGFGIGADLPVSLATIAESASDRNRGKLILLSNLLWAIGILAAIGIASFSGGLGRLGGQLLFGLVGIVALLVLIGRLTIPESELWIEARQELKSGAATVAPKAKFRDLLRRPYLVPLLALIFFYTLTNFGAGTTGALNTFIAVNFAGTTVEDFNRWAIVALLFGMAIGLLFMKFVDTKWRMTFFVVGAIVATASYFYLAIVGFTLTTMVIGLMLAVVGNAFAFEGIMKIWTQESFPTMLRSTAQGSILLIARVCSALVLTVTPALLIWNIQVVYIALGVLAAIGYVIAYLVFRGNKHNEFSHEAADAAHLPVSH